MSIDSEIEEKIYLKISFGFVIFVFFFCFSEIILYPGLWKNYIGLDLNLIVFVSSFLYLLYYMFKQHNGIKIVINKILFYFSYFVIVLAILLTIIEKLTFPNFIFYYLHINYLAIQTLATFLIFVLLLFNEKVKKMFRHRVGAAIFLFMIPLFSFFSWKAYISFNNLQKSDNFNVNSIIELVSGKNSGTDNTRKKLLLLHFKSFFIKDTLVNDSLPIFGGGIKVSLSVWYLFIATLFYLNWLQSEKSKRLFLFLLNIYFSGIIFTIFTIISCVTMFSTGELTFSLMRYLLTYVIGLFCFSLFIFIYFFIKADKKNLISIVYIILLLINFNYQNLINIKPVKKNEIIQNKKNERNYYQLTQYFDENTRLHILDEDIVGLRYYLAPVKIISPIWQSGIDFIYNNQDFKNATHIYIKNKETIIRNLSTEEIEELFGSNEVYNNSLYKVDWQSTGNFKLQLQKNFNF